MAEAASPEVKATRAETTAEVLRAEVRAEQREQERRGSGQAEALGGNGEGAESGDESGGNGEGAESGGEGVMVTEEAVETVLGVATIVMAEATTETVEEWRRRRWELGATMVTLASCWWQRHRQEEVTADAAAWIVLSAEATEEVIEWHCEGGNTRGFCKIFDSCLIRVVRSGLLHGFRIPKAMLFNLQTC